jgi:DNA primase
MLACYGTNGFTEEHSRGNQITGKPQRIILFFDGDKAGKEGVKKNANILKSIQPKSRSALSKHRKAKILIVYPLAMNRKYLRTYWNPGKK